MAISLGSSLQAPEPPSAITIASNAMQVVAGHADADASTLARSGPDVSALVDLDVQRDTFAALGAVVRASNEMLGSALDILA
jgi:hypothetical protein